MSLTTPSLYHMNMVTKHPQLLIKTDHANKASDVMLDICSHLTISDHVFKNFKNMLIPKALWIWYPLYFYTVLLTHTLAKSYLQKNKQKKPPPFLNHPKTAV